MSSVEFPNPGRPHTPDSTSLFGWPDLDKHWYDLKVKLRDLTDFGFRRAFKFKRYQRSSVQGNSPSFLLTTATDKHIVHIILVNESLTLSELSLVVAKTNHQPTIDSREGIDSEQDYVVLLWVFAWTPWFSGRSCCRRGLKHTARSPVSFEEQSRGSVSLVFIQAFDPLFLTVIQDIDTPWQVSIVLIPQVYISLFLISANTCSIRCIFVWHHLSPQRTWILPLSLRFNHQCPQGREGFIGY